MTSQHYTGTHPFYIGMYIHIYTHIYVHIYTSQKECLCIFSVRPVWTRLVERWLKKRWAQLTFDLRECLLPTSCWFFVQLTFGEFQLRIRFWGKGRCCQKTYTPKSVFFWYDYFSEAVVESKTRVESRRGEGWSANTSNLRVLVKHTRSPDEAVTQFSWPES